MSLAGDSIGQEANHWVALVIQTNPPTLLYADPMGHPPPQELLEVARWWLAHYHVGEFALTDLPCTRQPVGDGDSCGLLSANAIRHFCYPSTPLLDVNRIPEVRIDVLISVMKLVQKRVGPQVV